MDVIKVLENHERRLRRLEESLHELITTGLGGLKTFPTFGDFPMPGQDGFIYLDESSGISYYWDGTQYLPLASSTLTFQTFPTSADFPNPGIPGVLYMAEDTGNLYFWNGTNYVNTGGGLKVYADVAAFPIPGEPTFLYYAQLEKTLWYWDGTQYVPVVDPATFIQNQNAVAQPANFWIAGEGKITSDGSATNLTLEQTNPANAAVIKFNTPQVPEGYLAFGETSNPANIMSLIVPGTGVAWHFHKGALITNSFEDGVGASVVLKNLVLSKTSDDTGLAAGVKAAILYDGEFGQYRMVIKPNGNWIVGGGTTDDGTRFQINGGPIRLASNAADYPGVNGAMFYRSDSNKFRAGVNGQWTDLMSDAGSMISGLTVYVDSQSPNATNNRTGLSMYSQSRPFQTIQAAMDAVTLTGQSPTVRVAAGTYNENVSISVGNPFLTLELCAGVFINGGIACAGRLHIIGTGAEELSGPSGSRQPFALIAGNSANPTVSISHRHGNELNIIKNVGIVNGGSGAAVYVFNTQIINCDLYSETGVGLNNYGSAFLRNTRVKSNGNNAIAGSGVRLLNSVVISESAGGHDTVNHAGVGNVFAENSKIYSKSGYGIVGNNWGGTVIVRNCLFNTYNEAFNTGTGAGAVTAEGLVEVTGNIMNVRNPAMTNAFTVNIFSGPNNPLPPVIMGNRMNKASFSVNANGQPNTVADNIFELPFNDRYPLTNDSVSYYAL